MTFKHSKFEDSPIMRSLEKVAIEKGLVLPDVLTKQASTQNIFDLSVSMNLTENIIKLCQGLRQSNLSSYAEELESNFMNYKRAQNLYDTFKETGEDLVHEAHPEGSHKLEDVEGDVIIETIIDQHLQNLKMLDKKPTGKLSNARKIINSVKIILAQDTSDLETKLSGITSKFLQIIQRIRDIADPELTISTFSWSSLLNKYAGGTPNIENLSKAQSTFSDFISRIKPGVFGGVTEDTWPVIQKLSSYAQSLLSSALETRKKINESKAAQITEEGVLIDKPERVGVTTVSSPEVYTLEIGIKNAISTLNSYRASINSDSSLDETDKNTGLSWINSRLAAINSIKSEFEALNDEEKSAAAPSLRKNLSKIVSGFDKFYQGWIA